MKESCWFPAHHFSIVVYKKTLIGSYYFCAHQMEPGLFSVVVQKIRIVVHSVVLDLQNLPPKLKTD